MKIAEVGKTKMYINLYSKLSSSVLLRLTYIPIRKTSVNGYFEKKMVPCEKSKEISYSRIGANASRLSGGKNF